MKFYIIEKAKFNFLIKKCLMIMILLSISNLFFALLIDIYLANWFQINEIFLSNSLILHWYYF